MAGPSEDLHQPDRAGAETVLVFPPLVESGFGNVYPSTAVLAAYLGDRGHQVRQIDLNNAFIEHLIDHEELSLAADAAFRRSTPTSIAAARWVQDARRRLALDAEDLGAEAVATDIGARNVRRALTTPYTVDPGPAILLGRYDDPVLVESYDRYFGRWLDGFGPPDGKTLVGISVPMGPQLLPALRLAALVRARSPLAEVVMGGPALSLLCDDDLGQLLLSHPAISAVVRYDGEIPLGLLADQIAEGRWAPDEVPATSFLHDGAPVHNPPAAGPKLNDLPTPAYTVEQVRHAPAGRLGVLQARGCYWGKCDYCDFVEVYEGSPSYRGRRPERVVDDIARLVERTGVRRYRLITESIPPQFSRRFAQALIDADLGIAWSSFVMVDRRFDTETLALMAASGCDQLVVGLESMVTRVLRHVHKSADREENIRFLRDASAAGIELAVNLIPDLPSTTLDEAMAGLADLEQLADCFADVDVLRFETTRSSRVGRDPGAFGLVPIGAPKRRGQAQLAINALAVDDPAMTAEEWEAVVTAYDRFAARVNAERATERGEAGPRRTRSYYAAVEAEGGRALVDFVTMRMGVLDPAGG